MISNHLIVSGLLEQVRFSITETIMPYRVVDKKRTGEKPVLQNLGVLSPLVGF